MVKTKSFLFNLSSWALVLIAIIGVVSFVLHQRASATTSGQMTLYFHKEASDVNETYNALALTPPEPATDTPPGTLSSATNVNATPPTAFCESTDTQTDAQNERVASAASTGNRCLGTFLSMPIGNAISISTSDTNAITSQLWSSESATQAAVALNVYLYRWTSGTTVSSGDRIATLTCAEPSTSATTCSVTATPANNISFAATDRIIAIVSSNVTTLRSGADTRFYFDSTGRTATKVTLKYTALGYNTSNKPSLSGTLDDDFTTAAATTACSTSGVAYNTKWTCLQGSASNTAGAFNAQDAAAAGGGDSSSWLWLRNQTTNTAATTSNFGATPSNTFLYQTMPSAYADGTIRTAVNSSATFGVGATSPTTPFNHAGLVLWTSNTDYLELQVYSDAATTGTNSVKVVLNNSGTLGTATSLNPTTTSGIFGEIWLGFTNTAGTWQGQYSTDGTTWNNVGSSVSHSTSFTRTGLNSFVKIANPVSTYAGAFEWFSYALADPTYNQTSYQWFANANSTSPGSVLNGAAQNTTTTLTSTGQELRLRQLIKSSGSNAPWNTTSFTSTDVDSSNSVGRWPSMVLGADGFARTSYYDVTNGNLKFAQCTNTSCSAKNITTVDTGGDVGDHSDIALGSDGFARIVYSATTSDVKFARCTNADCSSVNIATITSVGTGGVGYNKSIALGTDGFARIAYYDPGAGGILEYIQCTNADCTTSNINIIESPGIMGADNAIAIGTDGFARIAYRDDINGDLKFAQCTNNSCSTKNLTTIDNADAGDGNYVSVALGADGFARISEVGGNALKFVQCTNAACSTKNINIVDSSNGTAVWTSVSMAASDGFARISYESETNSTVLLATCTNAACSTKTISVLASSIGLTTDSRTSIGISSGGTISISYYYQSGSDLRLLTNLPMFKLQYSQSSTCSSASYSDVTSSTAIAFKNNSTPADNDTITYQSGTDPTDSGQTVTAQTYKETGNFYNTSAFGNTVDGEWDFSLIDNGAPANTSYCFKVVNGEGSNLTTYTNYPAITTYSSGPTVDQVMRGGQWFSNGTKQAFYWAN
jgi:hypothetical protein